MHQALKLLGLLTCGLCATVSLGSAHQRQMRNDAFVAASQQEAPASVRVTAQENPEVATATMDQIVRKLQPSVVFVLLGYGNSKIASASLGVVLSSDGIILTQASGLDKATQVQIRAASGDVYNNVELLGVDAQKQIAVLRIPAAHLTPISFAPPDEVKPGAPVTVISTVWGRDLKGLACSVKGTARAEDATSAGKGFSLIEIASTDWLAPSQIVVDGQARAVGMLIDSVYRYRNFALPLDHLEDLTSKGAARPLPNGTGLQLSVEYSGGSAAGAKQEFAADALTEIAKKARTIQLASRSELLPVEPLERKLQENKDFQAMGMVVVKGTEADLQIYLDRPLFTWDFTFSIVDRRTGAVLGSGKVIAWDGVRAAPGLAEQIVKRVGAYRSPRLRRQRASQNLDRAEMETR